MEDPPVVDEEYLNQIERARRVFRALVTTMNCAPVLRHLAWVDASDYDITTNTGGTNGSVRFSRLAHTSRGAKQGIQILDRLKIDHPRITYADLIQLGGVVAVEVTGGPTIEFVPGRKDSLPSPQRQPPVSYQDEDLKGMYKRMGLSEHDLVVLSGAREPKTRVGYANGDWFKSTAAKFDNSYFADLLEDEECGQDIPETQRFLLEDPYRPYIIQFAEDEDAFFKAYAESHKKFSELGFTPTPIITTTNSEEVEGGEQLQVANDHILTSVLAQNVLLVALGYVSAVLVLGYFYELKRRAG